VNRVDVYLVEEKILGICIERGATARTLSSRSNKGPGAGVQRKNETTMQYACIIWQCWMGSRLNVH
jgi:hypothetical protein